MWFSTKPTSMGWVPNNPLESIGCNGLLLKFCCTTWVYTTNLLKNVRLSQEVLQNLISPRWNLTNNLLKETPDIFETLANWFQWLW